ncbi:MAG TPA: xanthine dehydrogenase family protein molybdopterin-binding subunit [Streptosporangiaceae bacterium]|nr:xanthine dehydrogenase family protein molybdopterin-binding subunit [Streptosporangiaceae bacterium]
MSDANRPTGYVGARAPRVEDSRLVTGTARFVDGVRLPGMLHAALVRSPIAHGTMTRCDPAAALAAPGVRAVLTPRDVAGVRLPCVTLAPGQRHTSYPVLTEEIRHAGQPLALVVAESAAAAEDAAELVELDFGESPAVVGAEAALDPAAPLLYPEWGTNLVSEFAMGDADAAAAAADHVVELTLRLGRIAPCPIEPRGVVAAWEPHGGELTLWTSTQAAHHVRDHLGAALGIGYDRVRVIGCDVGGGFGAKEHIYPDEVLVCLAATRLGRPVKWTETRSEHFAATLPARDAVHRARLALAADGSFVALYADIVSDLGAYPTNVGASPAAVSAMMLPGPYRFPHAGARVRAVVTTTPPTGSFRGFGQPEITWTRERLIDEAARRIGVDPVELRLRNMVRPAEFPYATRTWQSYDSGDYAAALELVRDRVAARHTASGDGRRRGVGFSFHVEHTGLGPSAEMEGMGMQAGGYEIVVVRMEPDASIVVESGVCAMGQGIETTLAQVAADRLAVSMDRVRVALGDTARAPYSSLGSIASRSLTVGGAALIGAADRLRDRILAIAAHRLEATPGDLEITDGAVRVKGDPAAEIALAEIATAAWRGWNLPEGMAPGLEEREVYDPPANVYGYAAHAAAVAVDPDTGKVEIEGYWVANDCGVVVNPAIVEGQLHGAVVQGIGMALSEELAYSPDGQPLTTTFMDYLPPSAREAPPIEVHLIETPSPVTPGGMKGVGESGVISAPAAIGNAVAAALPQIAGRLTATPLTPYAVWSALRGG